VKEKPMHEGEEDESTPTEQEGAVAVDGDPTVIVAVDTPSELEPLAEVAAAEVDERLPRNVLRDQHRIYEGRDSGSALRNPDFQIYAKSFGVPSWVTRMLPGLMSRWTIRFRWA
jgi:hypothetical protein